jgi:hypothetical protein
MLSITKTVVSKNRMTGEYELERMWSEAAVSSFKVLYWHWLVRTEETHKKSHSG